MLTITEWNRKQQELYDLSPQQPQPAGVLCAVCGNEMLQQDNTRLLQSMPPRVRVWCLCGASTTKIV